MMERWEGEQIKNGVALEPLSLLVSPSLCYYDQGLIKPVELKNCLLFN